MMSCKSTIIHSLLVIFLWPAISFSEDAIQHTYVEVKDVRLAKLHETYDATGECILSQNIDFFARESGVITELNSADSVKAGDVIIKINGPAIEAKYNAAEISFKRDSTLFAKNIISVEAIDRARINFENAKLDYENMIIKAPFDGAVGVIKKKVGDRVFAGEYLVSVTQGHSKEIVLQLPSKLIKNITKDTEVKVLEDTSWVSAKITSMSQYLSRESGNFLVKVALDDQNDLLHKSFVQVRFIFNEHEALVVPESAIMRNDKGTFVFVVNDSTAKRVNITTGIKMSGLVEVLSGLNVGDVIVVEGITKIYDNSKVSVLKK